MKVALYCRVSTPEQSNEGVSLDSQLSKLKLYAESKEYEIYDSYIDGGYSGKNTNRPEYQRMIQDVNNYDGILVFKIDRIHRNQRNFISMMDKLSRENKQFISLHENIDTSTAIGRFVMYMMQLIAQLESEQIGERVYTAMNHIAENGKGLLGGFTPYGYNNVEGNLEIVESESSIVKDIFNMKLKGYTFTKIAEILNNKGIHTRNGNNWTYKSISYILHNPVYVGWLSWNGHKYPNGHKAIIEKKTFNLVNKNSKNIILKFQKKG